MNNSMGKYKVKVLRDKCIGAASCVAIAAKTFKLDKEQKAVVLSQDADADDDMLLAAQSCPTAAIVVTDENGKQIWPITTDSTDAKK